MQNRQNESFTYNHDLPIKPTLMLYALLQKFIHQDIEGDELYTKVNQNVPAPDSEGWTIVLMERGSRFLWELQCGRKEQLLFEEALQVLAEVIAQTGSINLFTDGERRQWFRQVRMQKVYMQPVTRHIE